MIPTKQNIELIIASKEIILAISSQPWSNDNAQVSNQQLTSFLSYASSKIDFPINFVLAILPDTHQSHPHAMKRMGKLDHH